MVLLSRQFFDINIKLLTLFRYYHPARNVLCYKFQAYLLYLFLVLPVPVLGSLYYFFNDGLENNGLDTTFIIAEMITQIIKLFLIQQNSEKLHQCMTFFDNWVNPPFYKKTEMIMAKYSWICRRNCIGYVALNLIADISYNSWVFLLGNRALPAAIWLPFTTKSELSSFQFCLVFILVASGFSYICGSCAILDPTIGGIASLGSSQFELLSTNIENLSTFLNITEVTDENQKNKTLKNAIMQCITHHKIILRFVNKYEECFSAPVFFQFVGSILVLGFCCFELSRIDLSSFNALIVILILNLLLFEIYVYSYYGTVLFETSDNLTSAIYKSEWYTYDQESQKLLLILMIRSQRPAMVTAGKFLDLSIETFTHIIKTSYSFLAVLNNT